MLAQPVGQYLGNVALAIISFRKLGCNNKIAGGPRHSAALRATVHLTYRHHSCKVLLG